MYVYMYVCMYVCMYKTRKFFPTLPIHTCINTHIMPSPSPVTGDSKLMQNYAKVSKESVRPHGYSTHTRACFQAFLRFPNQSINNFRHFLSDSICCCPVWVRPWPWPWQYSLSPCVKPWPWPWQYSLFPCVSQTVTVTVTVVVASLCESDCFDDSSK